MDVLNIIQLAIILAVSIGLHEYAHSYASYKLWDPTPKLQGRLTPNPLRHIDPIWFIMIFLINFWRGKPVQINPMYYKNPLKWELIVALAWPFTNLILAIIWIFIILIYWGISWLNPLNLQTALLNNTDIVISFRWLFTWLNIALAIFNMLPIYPLDGYRLIKIIKPSVWFWMEKNWLLITIIFFFIVIGTNIFWNIIWSIVNFIFNILFTTFWNIFY